MCSGIVIIIFFFQVAVFCSQVYNTGCTGRKSVNGETVANYYFNSIPKPRSSEVFHPTHKTIFFFFGQTNPVIPPHVLAWRPQIAHTRHRQRQQCTHDARLPRGKRNRSDASSAASRSGARLRGLPGDLALAASEQIETIEWSELRWSVLVPAGVAANVILVLCRVAVDRARARGLDLAAATGTGAAGGGARVISILCGPAVLLARIAAWVWTQFIGRTTLEQNGLYNGAIDGDDDIFARPPRPPRTSPPAGRGVLLFYVLPLVVGWLLVLASVWNAVSCLFLRRRKYYLAERPLDDSIDSASAQIEPMLMVPLPAEADNNDDDSDDTTSGKGLLARLFLWWQPQQKLAPSVADLDSGRQQLVWTLDTWNPSVVNLHLLALFSPAQCAAVMVWPPGRV